MQVWLLCVKDISEVARRFQKISEVVRRYQKRCKDFPKDIKRGEDIEKARGDHTAYHGVRHLPLQHVRVVFAAYRAVNSDLGQHSKVFIYMNLDFYLLMSAAYQGMHHDDCLQSNRDTILTFTIARIVVHSTTKSNDCESGHFPGDRLPVQFYLFLAAPQIHYGRTCRLALVVGTTGSATALL